MNYKNIKKMIPFRHIYCIIMYTLLENLIMSLRHINGKLDNYTNMKY